MYTEGRSEVRVVPWNKGKLLGQKPSLKLDNAIGLQRY